MRLLCNRLVWTPVYWNFKGTVFFETLIRDSLRQPGCCFQILVLNIYFWSWLGWYCWHASWARVERDPVQRGLENAGNIWSIGFLLQTKHSCYKRIVTLPKSVFVSYTTEQLLKVLPIFAILSGWELSWLLMTTIKWSEATGFYLSFSGMPV